MCGIIGIYGSFNKSQLKEGVEILRHRGPDDSGFFIDSDSSIGLGHTRLSIQDLSSAGSQPMTDERENVVLIYNGEIYNFRELREGLINKGYSFNGFSDTEVLLNLYLEKGKWMFHHLNGIFALAIWDKTKSTLLIARDAIGVKPLYYSNINNSDFAFASEIKALIKLFPSNNELDLDSINRYLAFLWCPGSGTPLKSIKKLLPGEAMEIKNGSISNQWSWYKLPVFDKPKKKLLNEETSIDGIRSNLKKAVQMQMVSDVPLGAFLSGGLDSSSVVAFAKEKNPNIRCFSIDTQGIISKGDVNDLPYAKAVAKHLNVPLEVATIDSKMLTSDLETMVRQLDEPLADPAALNVFYISKLAREKGIKVLLSGAGGDDLFTGYRRHHALKLEKYWSWMPKNIRSSVEHLSTIVDVDNTIRRRASKMFSGASLDKNDRLINYFRWSNDPILKSLYTKEFSSELENRNTNEVMQSFIEPILNNSSPIDQMLSLEQRFFLADHNLNYTDKMSMAAGVEVRTPFLDKDFVEFASQIPHKFKQRGSVGKWVFKKAMEPYLPKEIIYRPKTGFGVPLRRWMKSDLKEMLCDLLSVDSVNSRGLFSSKSIEKLITDNDKGKVDASYTLLSLLCIEIWCRAYIDQ
tara:strand:- start:2727 stop:4628 length:1902 start_codon:yes stop_codon:yes gene_type:complete